MDNLSGSGSWFKEDTKDNKENNIEEVQIELPLLSIDTSGIEAFIKDLEIDYAIHNNKNIGDSLLYFNMGLKELRKWQT